MEIREVENPDRRGLGSIPCGGYDVDLGCLDVDPVGLDEFRIDEGGQAEDQPKRNHNFFLSPHAGMSPLGLYAPDSMLWIWVVLMYGQSRNN